MSPTPRSGYHLADGTPVPGTTTIIGRFDDKAGLMFWAFEKGKKAGFAGKHNARLYDEKDEAEIGTYVHAMVLEDLHGRAMPEFPPNFTDAMKQAANNSFENYQREIKRSKAFFMPWEAPLVSEKYKYGGTPDAAVQFEETLDGGDWKSSKSIYVNYIIQAAAYRQLWNENHPTMPMKGFRLYRFAKESGAFSEHYFGPNTLNLAFAQFLLFRDAYENDKLLKKSV